MALESSLPCVAKRNCCAFTPQPTQRSHGPVQQPYKIAASGRVWPAAKEGGGLHSSAGECLFDRLPAEVVAVVLGFVPPSNLTSLLRVCRSWTATIEFDVSLWYAGLVQPRKLNRQH
jgi:hypothetical protein